jgi:hypothetical protein
LLKSLWNQSFLIKPLSLPVGMAGAFTPGMMMTITDTDQRHRVPCCTREEAARLLEELRAEYQRLSHQERAHVKSHFSELARMQSARESNWEK